MFAIDDGGECRRWNGRAVANARAGLGTGYELERSAQLEYVRTVNPAAFDAASAKRFMQSLADASSGVESCTINVIKTPAGAGSPAGRHTHEVDQIFYVLSGMMSIEVAGTEQEVPPGSLVVFPAGVPHRNWNAGSEPTVHLAFNAPAPDPSKPFATPA